MKKRIAQIMGVLAILSCAKLDCAKKLVQKCPVPDLLDWQVRLSVAEDYKGKDGGYIGILADIHGEKKIMGLMRLKGKYHKDMFKPKVPLEVFDKLGSNFKKLIRKYAPGLEYFKPEPDYRTGVFRKCKWFY